jgi:hypothetical protein
MCSQPRHVDTGASAQAHKLLLLVAVEHTLLTIFTAVEQQYFVTAIFKQSVWTPDMCTHTQCVDHHDVTAWLQEFKYPQHLLLPSLTAVCAVITSRQLTPWQLQSC